MSAAPPVSATRDIVLAVDDEPGTLGMLNEALEQAGYTVLLAQSAAAAMAVLVRVTPDIVLIDALMPGMDGFEACRQMRRTPALAGVPIIFMTGLTESEHVLRGFEAGGVDYVTKPVSPEEVIARIGVHLANARRTRSAQVALDAAGRFLLATDPAGQVLWATPQAATLLAEAQVASGILTLPTDAVPGRVIATVANLEFHFVGRIGPGEILFRLVSSHPSRDELLLKDRLGLTRREAQVLLWLGQGKSNRDIASILGLSPRTVNKHLEQIFTKLGVENRASAAALSVRTLST
jgi:DNA-binding response OmpR family regulator/DNA-binding CsgD family transcriptional regulator